MVPILAALACIWLMVNLSIETWLRFVIWMALGVIVYFAYGRRHSILGRGQPQPAQPELTPVR